MIITPPISTMKNAFAVTGLRVIVTGGNRGIGLGIAHAYAESVASVAILCRNTESGSDAARDLTARYGGDHIAVKCDISDYDSVTKAVDDVYAAFGQVDVLINNAGIAGHIPFLSDQDMAAWNSILKTNLNGPANMVHAVAPRMKDAGRGGSIINISSIAGQSVAASREHPDPGYNASKAALDHFTRYLAIELGDHGIRVNGIAPGPTHSDLDVNLPKETFERIEKAMPMHRFGEPLEIGALCVFLTSKAGCQITGVVIAHDGGMVLVG
jgi:NAD(P)-dependent dehydrogenase (short-subunit alcohol dehydrogenase family)